MKKSLLVAATLAALSGSAVAGSTSANFQTTATLGASCSVSASDINFGAITPAETGEASANGSVTATCSKGLPVSIAISAGNSGTFAQRTMGGTGGNTDKLAYNLYTMSNNGSVWGDKTEGTSTIGMNGTGIAQTKTIYGILALNQYLKPDTYTDNLTVTLSY